MRLAQLVSGFPKRSQTFILNQFAGLLDAGHDLCVFARRRPDESVDHDIVEEYGLRERTTYTQAPETYLDGLALLGRAGVGLLREGYGPRAVLSQFRHGKHTPERLAKIREFRRQTGLFDICHAHFGPIGARFRGTQRHLDSPLVISFYGADASRTPHENPGLYDGLFEDTAAVTCLSEDMRGDLVDLGCPPEKLQKVPLCIDTGKFTCQPPALAEGEPVQILSVARFVEKKGLEYAVRAVANADTDRKIRYAIAGDGPRRERLEALIESEDVHDRVDLLGWQSQEEISALLADSHLFVLPSVTAADGDKEGTPTVLLEAQAAGLPVLSTTHAGIPEIVADGETGLLVPERDADALADALEELLARPERWAQMGQRGHDAVRETHSIEAVTERLTAVYEAVQ